MEIQMQALLEAQEFWPHLTADERALLYEVARPMHYAAGEAVRPRDTTCLGPLFIASGVLRIYLLAEDGREVTIYRLRAGETCVLSASCVLSAITFDVEIEAETDCDVLLLPTCAFSKLMTQNLHVENFMYKKTTERLSDLIGAVERLFFLTLRQRVAAFLIDETAQQNANTLALTQEQLARAIGSAREAVSRTLKQLAHDGAIEVSRGEIHVRDKASLYSELSNT